MLSPRYLYPGGCTHLLNPSAWHAYVSMRAREYHEFAKSSMYKKQFPTGQARVESNWPRMYTQQTTPSPNLPEPMKYASNQKKNSQTVRFAENIALLALLDPMPKSPTSHAPVRPSKDKQDDVRRTLSMSQESELAINLAFLAAISDSHEHIMAVCIEELPKAGGCRVMIAINKRRPIDGVDVLSKVKKGFQTIFGRLRKLSSGSRASVENAIFQDIVALCYERILGRLRSRHSVTSKVLYKSSKRFVGLVLQDFLRSPWQERLDKSKSGITTTRLKKYRRRLRDLLTSLNNFEAADTVSHEVLLSLVDHIARFMETVPLAKLLGGLRKQDMAPSSRKALLNCLSKISRYRECARFLCRKAKQIPMLRNTTVQQVSQDAATSGAASMDATRVDLEQSLRRFQYKGKPIGISSLPKWLREIVVDSQTSFADGVKKIVKEAKVHAEIQLLAHSDSVSGDVVPPRVLAASKDACSLCYSLIRLHGKYEVPKAHGKLYTKWRLPAIYQEGPLQRDLNHFLEKQISATLQRLMTLTERPLILSVNESSIFPINVSASTLAGPSSAVVPNNSSPEYTSLVQQVAENATGSKVGQRLDGIDLVDDCHGEAMKTPVEGSSKNQKDPANEAHVADNDAGSNDASTTTVDSMANDPQLQEETVRPGQTITFESAANTRRHFRTRSINLFIDHSSSRFSFEWLSKAEAKAVVRTNTHAVLDIGSISSGVDVTLTKDADGRMYVKNGKEVIMIRTLETQALSS